MTLDAMGCQKAIAATIVEKEADYLLSVKENQPGLREIVEESLECGMDCGVEKLEGSYAQSSEKRAGEVITREAWLVPAPLDLEELAVWAGLCSVGFIRRTVQRGEKIEVGQRFYITSVASTEARRVLEAAQEHWHIENQLEPCLPLKSPPTMNLTHAYALGYHCLASYTDTTGQDHQSVCCNPPTPKSTHQNTTD